MFDQIAVYTTDIEGQVIKAAHAGLGDWTRDVVTADARVAATLDGHSEGPPMEPVQFQAKLAFNYEMNVGLEFEYIQPITPVNYIKRLGIVPGQIAHMGIHVEEGQDPFQIKMDLGLEHLIQDCWTQRHENRDVPADRTYHYTIWTSRLFPWPVKLIERHTKSIG